MATNPHFEIDTFVSKFRNLWQAGRKASLTLESDAGKAWVSLYLDLGALPLSLDQPQHQQSSRRNGPSQRRRRERRAVARQVVVVAEKAVDSAEKADDNSIEKMSADAEKAEAATNVIGNSENEVAEEASTNKLVIELPKEQDMPVDNIPQVDGQEEGVQGEDKVTYTFVSDFGEEDILYSLSELFPDTDNLETKLVSRIQVRPRSAHHMCTVTVKQVGGRISWPKMAPSNEEVFMDLKRIKP